MVGFKPSINISLMYIKNNNINKIEFIMQNFDWWPKHKLDSICSYTENNVCISISHDTYWMIEIDNEKDLAIFKVNPYTGFGNEDLILKFSEDIKPIFIDILNMYNSNKI